MRYAGDVCIASAVALISSSAQHGFQEPMAFGPDERRTRLRPDLLAFLIPVWGYTATASVTWMRMLDLESFRSAGDVWTYLLDLRTGIPPVLSALELLWWVQFRDLTLFTDNPLPDHHSAGLHAGAGASAGPAAAPHRPCPPRRLPGESGGRGACRQPSQLRSALRAPAAGLFPADRYVGATLSSGLAGGGGLMPFAAGTDAAIHDLPSAAVPAGRRASDPPHAPRRGLALAAFLLPVVVLSGGWHLHLYLAHDHQIAWTNISGYNLQRAWEDLIRRSGPYSTWISCRATASFGPI